MKTVRPKEKGEAVEVLQKSLLALGLYGGGVDGKYGLKLKNAVVAFQTENALEPDGIVGPKTWKVLNKKIQVLKQKRKLATYRYYGPNTDNQNRATQIDDETALWCARMCIGEGGKRCSTPKATAMLWAIMNRWMLHPSRKHWPTYFYLLRRFSQPINPRWQKGGDLAKKYAGTESTSLARLRRRAKICALEWEDIPDRIVETIRAFQTGTLPPPEPLRILERPRISNWASHRGLSEKYPWGVSFEKSKQPDWFFEDERLITGQVVVDFWR